MPAFSFLHPYFPHQDPERRWLFLLDVTVPAKSIPALGSTAVSQAEIMQFNAQSVTLPSVTIDPIIIPHLNQDIKVAGRPTLGEMTVTFLTAYNMDSVAVLESWHHCIYNSRFEELGLAFDYKTNGQLYILTPELQIYKEYGIKGMWPSSIGDKDYDWTASESTTRTVTFQVDKVTDPTTVRSSVNPQMRARVVGN